MNVEVIYMYTVPFIAENLTYLNDIPKCVILFSGKTNGSISCWTSATMPIFCGTVLSGGFHCIFSH